MKNRAIFIEKGINPEIYFNHSSLKKISRRAIADLAADLAASGLSVSVHAPFLDLSPGAIDPAFRSLTVQRLKSAIASAAPFRPDTVVLHPGYDPLRFAEHRGLWLKNSLKTWHEVASAAQDLTDTLLLIENIFEDDPSTLADLLDSLPTPPFGFCFDTGHFQVFSKLPLSRWIDALGPHLREVHLHDNDGSGDSHLPPGRGSFPFDELFRLLGDREDMVLGTIEAHKEQYLHESLAYLQSRGLSL
jgi:sugar phosphate isomerase/epimerase